MTMFLMCSIQAQAHLKLGHSPGGAIEDGRWVRGGAEGRQEHLLRRAACTGQGFIPFARDARRMAAITRRHRIRRPRPITHLAGPAAAGCGDKLGPGSGKERGTETRSTLIATAYRRH